MSSAASEDPRCKLSRCFCGWRTRCSPRIPRVAPGLDYQCIPAGADRRPAWSLLVGVKATHFLRLHRFRVARSGRVLGRTRDALHVPADDCYNDHVSRATTAQRSPDGRSLSLGLFSEEFRDPPQPEDHPRALQLRLDLAAADTTITGSVTPLPYPSSSSSNPDLPTCPIRAAGVLWAPFLTHFFGPCQLVMQRLDTTAGQWVAGDSISLERPMKPDYRPQCKFRPLQGFAVVRDTILLSLWPFHLFFAFDCSTQTWAPVLTSKTAGSYLPIEHRGVYVEEDDNIYSVSDGVLHSHKLRKDHQGQYRMAPPTTVDCLCPFIRKGDGFLAHLGDRLMCYVWIGVMLDCSCDTTHVLITTFRVKADDDNVPKGVQVLHSTCRQLDMPKPVESCSQFCFLQEYEEFGHANASPPAKRQRAGATSPPMLLEAFEDPDSSSAVESHEILACCRRFLARVTFHSAVDLELSAIQTEKSLYFISQVSSCSTVYKIKISDGKFMCHDETLTPHCILETFICDEKDEDEMMEPPLQWHFVCDNMFISAVPYKENYMLKCDLQQGACYHVPTTRPLGDEFSICLVLQVGWETIAISETLQSVYRLSHTGEWLHIETSGVNDLHKKVTLSGYVVLSDKSFMVSDTQSDCCFRLDLHDNKWTIVMPYSEYKRSLQEETELVPSCFAEAVFLNGRSVFAEGFIYTCSDDGLEAYEFVEEGGYYYLGDRIVLPFSWRRDFDCNGMCLDYVDKDTSSGAIMFCVMKDSAGVGLAGYPDGHLPVNATTVLVKTEGMPNGKLKPKTIGHSDIFRSSVKCKGSVMRIPSCFAVSPF
ncbi:hypothetical protein ACP70R_028091 [Stipagrostis hirtigluma subsp. patula]